MLSAALSASTPPSNDTRRPPSVNNSDDSGEQPRTAHIRIVPHLDSSRSLVFSIIERDLTEDTVLKIGRFTDRFLTSNRITFRSKVVSRGHAEIWSTGGKVYIRDTKSSSGTFLNHVRLSAPNQESKSFELRDGDVVQLGVDYQGGTEEIYRAVKMRIEVNRTYQQTNTFSTFQSLRNLTTPPNNISVLDAAMGSNTTPSAAAAAAAAAANRVSTAEDPRVEECCICLYALAPGQGLFVAPCSHTFHFKCCRPLLQHYPGFQCPLCRSYSDLDASVAIETDEVLQMLKTKEEPIKEEDDQEQEPTSSSSPPPPSSS
ncbi:SMAD/FHA domain-containing protein [Lichtheimia hyalospora FSU 10163]|nr:SMAD/FHA domain-containing protein [Lichtheimia hyalospora FSU 10163]